MKLSQSNCNIWSPDSDLVCSYLIATVRGQTAPDQLSIPLNKLPCTRMISQPHQMTMKRQVGDLSSTPDLRPDLRKTQMEPFQFCMLHLRVTDWILQRFRDWFFEYCVIYMIFKYNYNLPTLIYNWNQRVFGRWTKMSLTQGLFAILWFRTQLFRRLFYAMTSYHIDRTFPHFMILQ